MTLYVYKIGTQTPVLTIEHATTYTAEAVTTEDGTVYGPFADNCELSSLADCSESLRARWKKLHPSQSARMEMLETIVAEIESLMATLLFGGETA